MLSLWKFAVRKDMMKITRRRKKAEAMSDKIQNLLAEANSETARATSTATSASRFCSDETEARAVFETLKEKLFRINEWNAESEISHFELFDEDGAKQIEKRAVVGDFIKITLPGSGKSDWVKITEIYDAPGEIVLTIQPSPDPTEKPNSPSVSHFFVAASTNNFCLQRKEAKINFYVIGLNEQTNTENTAGIAESVRNLATANIGYFLGVQKTQWQTFCDNFVKTEKSKLITDN